MPCRLYLVNCLAINSSYLIPRFYPLQFARNSAANREKSSWSALSSCDKDTTAFKVDIHYMAVNITYK